MTPQEEYIEEEYSQCRLTAKHIQALTLYYQGAHVTLGARDGLPGPKTRSELEKRYPALFPEKTGLGADPFLALPLPIKGSRKPVITSGFRKPGRTDHDGTDWFYPWQAGDQPNFVGDGGCEGKNADGTPRWVVPYGTEALAAADGVVMISGPSETGYRMWIDHGNGLRSGYFHLEKALFSSGVTVKKGMPIGIVGHNPSGAVDGRHLHFEVSPVGNYAPVDPEKYLLKA